MITITVNKKENFNFEDINIPEFKLIIKGSYKSYAHCYNEIRIKKYENHLLIDFNYRLLKTMIAIAKRSNYSYKPRQIREFLVSFFRANFNLHPKNNELSNFSHSDLNLISITLAYEETSFQDLIKKLDDFWSITKNLS